MSRDLDDIDAVLAAMIMQAEKDHPFTRTEQVAVEAIMAMSWTGYPGWARRLMSELLQARGTV